MSRFDVSRKIGLAAMLLNAMLARGAGSYSIEPVTISSSVPKSIANDLDPSGVLLSTSGTGVKEEICTIFWAKTTTVVALTKPSANLGYSSIREGALVGVIHLFREATEDYDVDFSNQKLKPGYYTMRYAVQPAGVGEHGPYREILWCSVRSRWIRIPSEFLVRMRCCTLASWRPTVKKQLACSWREWKIRRIRCPG